MASHVQFSHMAREGDHLYRGEKEVGRAVVNRVHDFSLAESLPGKRSLSSSCWVLLLSQGMSTSLTCFMSHKIFLPILGVKEM